MKPKNNIITGLVPPNSGIFTLREAQELRSEKIWPVGSGNPAPIWYTVGTPLTNSGLFQYQPPSAPVQTSRHTLFYANYDDGLNANFCYGDATAGGEQFISCPGKFGRGVKSASLPANLFYRADHNISVSGGTISLWASSADGSPLTNNQNKWLFGWRGPPADGPRVAGAFIRGSDNSLIFSAGKRAVPTAGTLPNTQIYSLPLNSLNSDWHHIMVSWDLAQKFVWLGCDGSGITIPISGEINLSQPYVLFVGSAPDDTNSGAGVNISIDDFAIYDVALNQLPEPNWPIGIDSQLVNRAEFSAKNFLKGLDNLQYFGGWSTLYSWPNLMPAGSQGRSSLQPNTTISNGKGIGSAFVATKFLYAYEIFGNAEYLETARLTGDMFVTAWENDGYFSSEYSTSPAGLDPFLLLIYPSGNPPPEPVSIAQLQNANQSHPMFFLEHLYRLTKDIKYRNTAISIGEYILNAQNPNGSWSYGVSLNNNTGITAIGLYQGGEINDNCMNDAIDAMLLAYHITNEAKYLVSIQNAGEWLLSSQFTIGATNQKAGWAEQYDAQNNSVWARNFEPPGIVPGRSGNEAANAIRLLYYLTYDNRYLQSLTSLADWLDSTKIMVDGQARHWEYYDISTGRPIAGINFQIFYMDDTNPASTSGIVAYKTQLPPTAQNVEPIYRVNINTIRNWALGSGYQTSDVYLGRGTPTTNSLTESYNYIKDIWNIKNILDEQNSFGFWISPSNYSTGGYGPIMSPSDSASVINRPRAVMKFVENSRILGGELPFAYRGDGAIEKAQSAFPSNSWVITGLNPQPEAENWKNRVIDAGGTVSQQTMWAVRQFCRDIDDAGLRSKFYRLNLFCGDNLSGCCVPLYLNTSLSAPALGNLTDISNGFFEVDYIESGVNGGLAGNGSSKYLNTGLSPSNLPNVATGHLAAYVPTITTPSRQRYIGSEDSTNLYTLGHRPIVQGDTSRAYINADWGGNSTAGFESALTDTLVGGLISCVRSSPTSLVAMRNGIPISIPFTSNINPASNSRSFYIFGSNQNGNFIRGVTHKIMGYSIGAALTSQESIAYSNAMNRFQEALGRNT